MSASRANSHTAARSAGKAPVRSVNYATSPLLASPTPPWRSRFVVAAVAAAFAVLLGRALYLQVIHTEFYQAEGEKRFVHTQPLPASRGRILDRNGLPLASSVALPTVQVDTKLFAAVGREERAQLVRLLALKPGELEDRLEPGGTVVLRRHVEEPVWVELKALKLKGVHEVREFKRRYPEGEAAAQVVGFTDPDGNGISGIELAHNEQLLGRSGERTVVRDRLGRVVEDVGDPTVPVNGQDVHLAIDSKVQFFAWQRLREAVREHNALGGSAVVLDVQTGEVLALANVRAESVLRQGKPGQRQRNLALTDIFEPGSTMKPFTAALALERGPWTPSTPIDTAPGRIVVTGAPITDAHPHGVLTVAQVIQKSSNVGTVKMAMDMPAREMWELYTAIGLGQRPQIDFPGAITGRLRPHKSWRPVEKATMSYGYGLSTSLFQLARAYTVFARDGELIPATLLKREAADADQPVMGQRVMSAKTARALREMLRMAAGDGGTAPKAMTQGYSVGGKTGTARKQEGRGYSTSKYRAFFVGLAPVSNPRIVVAVLIDEPGKGVYYGGEVAAPVFSQVVQQTLRLLNVQPDLDVKMQAGPRPVTETESI